MEQNISMQAGWTGISSYVQPDDSNLEVLFESIIDDLVILQADGGVFWPEQNVNSLGNWESPKGYLIKLKDNAQLNLVGTVSNSKYHELLNGWNLLPIVSKCHVSILDLFDGSGVQVDFIMEVAGTGIYWPDMGINTLQQLEPGKSYYLKSTGSGTITFPECD
jgi:hypothetical protein